jgi:hypothetical protein
MFLFEEGRLEVSSFLLSDGSHILSHVKGKTSFRCSTRELRLFDFTSFGHTSIDWMDQPIESNRHCWTSTILYELLRWSSYDTHRMKKC